MKKEIKNIHGEVIYSHEQEDNSLKITLEKAVKEKISLRYADLRSANLRNADLENANLQNADFGLAKGVIQFNKLGGRECYAIIHDKELMIKAGCFWGTLSEFEERATK